MDFMMAGLSVPAFLLAMAIALFAGFVKGTIGFAMPMIMISGLSSFLPAEVALSGLILPTLMTNLSQAFRQGLQAFWGSVCKFRRFLGATVLFIAVSAPFMRDIPQPIFLAMLGIPITLYAVLQLMGRNLAIRLEHQTRAEWGLGMVAGLYGGVSGVWGPPLIIYLMSAGVEKLEMLRVQGVIFLLGSVMLFAAHQSSGAMTPTSTAFSASLVLPAMIGMFAGRQLGNRLDQARFRRWTQILLIVAGSNLIRRAIGL
jgi:uncharacterized membrane protein YfcA